MIQQYIAVNRALRNVTYIFHDRWATGVYADGDVIATIDQYLLRALRALEMCWPPEVDKRSLLLLKSASYPDAFDTLIPEMESQIDEFFVAQEEYLSQDPILQLLHPVVVAAAYNQYSNGQYRDAILNAIVSVFDLLRYRTKLDEDGSRLAQTAYSLDRPMLVVSTLETESGRNEQIGFMSLLKGAYQGIRNPKAHTLDLAPDRAAAAQNLVFASLLARRIEESKRVEQ